MLKVVTYTVNFNLRHSPIWKFYPHVLCTFNYYLSSCEKDLLTYFTRRLLRGPFNSERRAVWMWLSLCEWWRRKPAVSKPRPIFFLKKILKNLVGRFHEISPLCFTLCSTTAPLQCDFWKLEVLITLWVKSDIFWDN